MKISKLLFTWLLLTCSMLIGCNNPNEANEHNFKTAVQASLDANFPLCVINESFPTKPSSWDIHHQVPVYEEMVKLGLLSKVEVTVPPIFKWQKPTKGHVYDLTNEGKKYYKNKDEASKHKLSGFCVGSAKVVEIVNFTQPSDIMGKTLSEVQFTYAVSDLPDWIKNPEIIKLSDPIKKIVDASEKPADGEAKLILTGKGWMEISLFNQH